MLCHIDTEDIGNEGGGGLIPWRTCPHTYFVLGREGRSWVDQVCGLRDSGLAQRVLLLQHLQRLHGRERIHTGEKRNARIFSLNS